MMQLNSMEKLAVAQTLYSKVGEVVKTREPDNLRGEVDAEIRRLYETTGAKSFDVKLAGRKVGTYSVTVTKPTPEEHYEELIVKDAHAYFAWAVENGFVTVNQAAVDANFDATGEVPDGCEIRRVSIPGTPGGEIKSTTLKVDADAVKEALGPMLQEASAMLLEGGYVEG
jgi:hypothetical protein